MDYGVPPANPPACTSNTGQNERSALSGNSAFALAMVMNNSLVIDTNVETPINTPVEELRRYLREARIPITHLQLFVI